MGIRPPVGGLVSDEEVAAAVAALVAGAPGALDTLNELAAALGDDADFAATVVAALAGKQPLDADLTTLAGGGAPATSWLTALLNGAYQGIAGDSIWVPASGFTAATGSPSLTASAGGSRYPGWLLDAAITEQVNHGRGPMPSWWATFDVKIYWTNAGAGAGDVRWRVVGGANADAVSLATADATDTSLTVTAPAQDVLKVTTLAAGLTAYTNRLYNLRVLRTGAHAEDTLGNDCALLGVELARAS